MVSLGSHLPGFRVAWLIALFLALLSLSSAGAQELPVVDLQPGQSAGSLRDTLRFRPATGPDSETAPSTRGMQPIAYNSTQFGQTGSAVEGAMAFRNAGDQNGSWVLTTGRGQVNRFTAYIEEPDQAPRMVFDNRDPETLGRSLADYQAMAIPISLRPGEQATITFRFSDNISMWMPFQLQDPPEFFRERRINIAFVAAIVGGSLVLILVNALVFAVTGRREFIWLAAAEIAFALNTLHTEGYTNIFLLYRWPLVAELFGEITRSMFGLLMMQFGRAFLQTRMQNPRFDRLLRALIYIGLGIVAVTVARMAINFMPVMLLHHVGWLYLLATVMAMLVLGTQTLRRGAPFVPLFIAWTSMAIYIGWMTVAVSGLAPGVPVIWHWIGPVGLFECVMATISLALHLRALEDRRIASEKRARSALLEKLAISEEATRLAGERALALSEVSQRDRLIQESAHDTRHVLHALNSAVHFARSRPQGTSADMASLLEASARHLEDIIASSVSGSVGNGEFLALRAIDPATVAADLQEIYAPIAEASGLELVVQDGAPCLALLDEALFSRLASNLVNNALKFTEAGRVSVHYDCEEGLLRLSVSDTGAGMPRATAAWLNDHAGDAVDPGDDIHLGTGWRSLRDIVALMRGSYSVESGDQGTSVTVVLPNPLAHGATPASDAELASLLPDVRLDEFDRTDARAQGVEGHPLIVLADDSSAATRIAAAARSRLLLVRPLFREMAGHPYVEEFGRMPSSRALSTN